MEISVVSKPSRGVRPAAHHSQVPVALLLLCALVGPASAGAGSLKHGFIMRGQVLESGPGEVVVCVGKEDGAQVGQVLDVVRHVSTAAHGKNAGPRFRRVDVGAVRITTLFDGHYATAKVVNGSPRVHDVVELEQ